MDLFSYAIAGGVMYDAYKLYKHHICAGEYLRATSINVGF